VFSNADDCSRHGFEVLKVRFLQTCAVVNDLVIFMHDLQVQI